MTRRNFNIVMVLLAIGSIYTLGIQMPMQMSYYSPFMNIIDNAPGAPSRNEVPVCGLVIFEDINGTETPASFVEVRLFGTDDFVEDFVTTDEDGLFYSQASFEAGQIIKVTIEGKNFQRFVDYDAYELYYLDVFVVWI